MSGFPGISQFKAEPPLPGHGPLWQLNGCMDGSNPDDEESWAWLADISSGWGTQNGDLAKFLAHAANAHAALVAALGEVFGLLIERNPDFYTIGLDNRIRAALALARGGQP